MPKVPKDEVLELPKDEVGEKGLLCSALQNTAILLENETIITDDLFAVPANLRILDAIWKLAPHFSEVDFKTLRGEFDQKELEDIGGLEYLDEVFSFVPTPSAWKYYFDKAFDANRLRKAHLAASEILDLKDPEEAAEIAEETLKAIAAPKIKTPVAFKERVHKTLEWLEQLATNPPQSVIKFGINALDDRLLPVENGDQVIISAETSGGKSALASQAVLSSLEKTWAIFSAEMPWRSLVARMFAAEGRIPFSDLRQGRLQKCDYRLVTAAAESLANRQVWIEDEHPMDVHSIAAKCRQYKRKGLSAIVVDYLQLIVPATSGKRDTSREREVAEISRSLKSLALELQIVVVALSQLNEAGQLRESRAIGQDADIVLRIDHDEDGCSINIRKHRNGSRGSVPVSFDGALMRFSGVSKSPAQSKPVRLPYGEEAE